MKAGLITIVLDVIGPTFLSGLLVKSIEGAGAGADEYQVPGDRRSRPDSTACLKLPENPGVGLGKAMGSPKKQYETQDGGLITSHDISLFGESVSKKGTGTSVEARL